MLKDGLGSGTLSAPEVILMRLTEAGARHKKVWNQISKQRSYPTPFAAKFYSLAHIICAGKCWQLIWGPSFTVQFGSGKTWQQLVSITFVGQPVGHTSPNIVDFWGEGNKDGIEMLGNISNVFWGGASWDESQRVCYFIYVFVLMLICYVWKELEFKVGFSNISQRRQGCQRFILLPSDPKRTSPWHLIRPYSIPPWS